MVKVRAGNADKEPEAARSSKHHHHHHHCSECNATSGAPSHHTSSHHASSHHTLTPHRHHDSTSYYTPTPAATPSSSSSSPRTTSTSPPTNNAGGTTPADDIAAYLKAHNDLRNKHKAVALEWNETLADAAQTWLNKCVWEHSEGAVGPYGENLAAGTGDFPIPAAMKLWSDEEPDYNPSNPQYSHYTQMVWNSTRQIGCRVHSCDLSIFPSDSWVSTLLFAEYYPAGNIEGEFS
ncbi:CAP domain-containing protein [Cantharellus anzutake]|uniref:CAP domain-containing protein n=1 Tax=Cantharellus anzutake TaxID=1750568 RepID=UPI0019042480|nr:CAP domain-containing protein [Cantharellus anzutake]KAF8332052.1 CAP domain-containing protein [Cantharellus anzutake]